jgi:hypothetical protein
MQKRNVLNSPRLLELKKHRRRIFINKILLSAFAIILIFVYLVYISRIPSLNINEVEVVSRVADVEMIRTVVEKEITGNYLWFFPKTNILFYPKNIIQEELHNKFKKLKDINFSFKSNSVKDSIRNGKILVVSTTERTALYTWCGNDLTTKEEEKCYFMDETGYIFDEAPYFSGEVYFKFYGPASVGTYFSSENFKQLIYFRDILTTMKFKPASLHVLNDGDVKIFLSTLDKTSIEPYIAFKIDANFEKLAENLEVAINTEPLLSNLKNKYSLLEYIDLRFGNKVYYKFK